MHKAFLALPSFCMHAAVLMDVVACVLCVMHDFALRCKQCYWVHTLTSCAEQKTPDRLTWRQASCQHQ